MIKYVLCLTTVGNKKDAEAIASKLVGKRLVACVNVIPKVLSYYHWKGKICRDEEWILMMKTLSTKLKLLKRELHELHPYELPEFIVLPVIKGSASYLKWISDSLRESTSSK